ncbi:tetratricopeptide repeat protein 39B-like isoform X2, partial [Leptotrombidium deliense]
MDFKAKFDKNKDDENGIPMDKYALCLLMKGVCLRYMNKLEDSLRCFQEIINNGEKITYDTYILPNAYCEIGITYLKLERFDEAKACLATSKNNYTGYLMETLIHLRAHNALHFLKTSKK